MILIINSGSSSIKFRLYDIQDKNKPKDILEGLAERIGVDGFWSFKYDSTKHEFNDKLPNHKVALKLILDKLIEMKIIENYNDIEGVGFRVVHGGTVSSSSLISDDIYSSIVDSTKLAPLHNPGALVAIDAVKAIMPDAKLVASFDTAFHQTIPKENFLYTTPIEWYENHGVRKYGFHGISYQYILKNLSTILKKDCRKVNAIVCHLGNGASMAVIKEGLSFDTTMGLTPLAGLMMGTRSGDIDPSIIEYMSKELKKDVVEITTMLNKNSGLKGISKISSDMRDVREAFYGGNQNAKIAIHKYTTIVADFMVKYANYLNGEIDAIVFTAGIGENSDFIRTQVLDRVNILGLELDEKLNAYSNDYEDYKLISTNKSKSKVYAIKTNEELMICLDTISKIYLRSTK
ncbi:acetate/propionate family kinase [Spiroplasma endosymbiont of Othius punctulatus]|uniref:acetate/propionate family kinase n=1 Tax=Spiroplasma endosymbiont of Othius punctulatus TaxID=3066289 RepID=UPI0030D19CCE